MDQKDIQSKDVQAMISVLKDMGIEDYEPKVINQLLEFSYKYVTNILEDARLLSSHASKKTIDADDIKIALKSKTDYSFTTAPPRELLVELSQTKNKNPLPPIKYHPGIRLPPDRFCLHSTNYVLKSNPQAQSEIPRPSINGNRPIQVQSISNVQSPGPKSYQSQNDLQTLSFKRRRDEDTDYDA